MPTVNLSRTGHFLLLALIVIALAMPASVKGQTPTSLPTLPQTVAQAVKQGGAVRTRDALLQTFGKPHLTTHWFDAGDQVSWHYRVKGGTLDFIVRPSNNYAELFTIYVTSRSIRSYLQIGQPLSRLKSFLENLGSQTRNGLSPYVSGKRGAPTHYLTCADTAFEIWVDPKTQQIVRVRELEKKYAMPLTRWFLTGKAP